MQDSNLSVNRLNELASTISEARDSLNNWHDRKTEALIRLDAFTYDMQLLEEEKQRTNAVIEGLKRDIQKNEKAHQLQIGEITDQMQLLKLDNEVLKNEIRSQEAQKFEIIAQAEQQQVNADQQISILGSQIQELETERNELNARADRLESELAKIRAQVLNVLQTNESTASEIKKAVEYQPSPVKAPVAPKKVIAPAPIAEPKETFSREVEAATFAFASSIEAKKEKASTDLSMSEVKKLRAVETEPATVEEYLKRLGY